MPLLLFVLLQSGFQAREERRTVEAKVQATSAALMLAADGEVRRDFTGLDALATTYALHTGDLAEFRARTNEMIGLNRGWRGAVLIDRQNGAVLADIGSAGLKFEWRDTSPPDATPRFIGVARGPSCPCLVFDRAAASPAGHSWAVRLLVDAAVLQELLPPRSEYEVSAIVDPSGRFLARSVSPAARFGAAGSSYLRGAVASDRAKGVYFSKTLEGFQSYTGFARSPLTGWTAHAALATRYIDNPARRFIASLGLAALLSVLLAAALIWFALRQVAEGRRVAERMQQAQKLEALGQLTGGIAHDFNNLLTPVIGAIDFVSKKDGLDASSKRLLGGALSSARRAGKLTAQLLAFSRRQKLVIEPIDIGGMLDELGDLLRQSVGNDHALTIVQADRSLCAMSDLNQLELAILNLMLNARDASSSGDAIRIEVTGTGTPDAGDVIIRIVDDGVGMDEATLQRAIDPFFTTKPLGHGTGLGLAQVFGMAAQSGGRLDIASAPGEGTVVSLKLRRCAVADSRPTPILAAVEGEQASLRLLVVDDDPLVRLAVVRPLEEAGHIVDAVSDGATALAAIREREFDLVLVDFAMPGMDGAELIRRARAVRPEQSFLMVTGYADSEAVAEAAPDVPIVKKPFEPADLVAMAERAAG